MVRTYEPIGMRVGVSFWGEITSQKQLEITALLYSFLYIYQYRAESKPNMYIWKLLVLFLNIKTVILLSLYNICTVERNYFKF